MIDLSEEFFDEVESLRGSDFCRERLKARGDEERMFAILQAEARKKCRNKLGRTLSLNPRFIFPDLLAGEQASDDRIAEFHASLVAGDDVVADATAGLGIDAMALARKCRSVEAFEMIPGKAEALGYNARNSGLRNLTVRNEDSILYLKDNPTHYDVIFIDPARRDDHGGRVYSLADCTPDVVTNLDLLMSHCDRLIIKMSPMLDVADTLRRVAGVKAIFAIGTTTECKEIAVEVAKGVVEMQEYHAVTVTDSSIIDLRFTAEEMDSTPVVAQSSAVKKDIFIIEPYPAVMKLDCGGALCERVSGLKQIAPNTHLFISEWMPEQFAGRVYRGEGVYDFDKRGIRQLRTDYPELNVTCRNFPLKAPELVKRLKIKEGGNRRLFAVTLSDGERVMMVGE